MASGKMGVPNIDLGQSVNILQRRISRIITGDIPIVNI